MAISIRRQHLCNDHPAVAGGGFDALAGLKMEPDVLICDTDKVACMKGIKPMNEIIFRIDYDPKGGYNAQALGYSIFTEGETTEELKANMNKINKLEVSISPSNGECNYIGNYLNTKFAELDKMRQAAEQQLEAIEALPGAILREVFDFEEDT